MSVENLMSRAKKEFYEGELLSEDVKKSFEIVKSALFLFQTRPDVLITCYGSTWLTGEFKGMLDAKSKKALRNNIDTREHADLLIIKEYSEAYKAYFNRGFYHYNPHKINSDKIVALKICT